MAEAPRNDYFSLRPRTSSSALFDRGEVIGTVPRTRAIGPIGRVRR
jgi:hypothetical protein